ncbi:4a-hydroxytetrahydrobiopterin dehydratase [Candidatus Daviesbacteria bacterium]|nr:4a-hydroxytetrahydrobiopterin dehydratase [Candidatus Daviesbacteria bacterium]
MSSDLAGKKCIPCEIGTPPLPLDQINVYLKETPGWELVEPKEKGGLKIERNFKFKDFKEAMVFVNKVATLAAQEGHHPNIKIFYSKVVIELTTHSIGGLSENDFILAAKIDQV